jgi:hypothetical protein
MFRIHQSRLAHTLTKDKKALANGFARAFLFFKHFTCAVKT